MTHHLPRTCNVNATCERTLMKSDLFIDVNMWQTPFCAAEDSAVGEKEEGPVTVGGKPSLVGYCQLRMEQNNHKEEEEEKSDEHLTDQEEEARKKEKKMEEKEDREEFAAVEKKTPTGEKNMEEKKENKEFVTDSDQEEEARKKEKKMEEKEDREEFATVVRSSRDKSTRPQRSSKGFLCCSRAGADDTD
ncbi:uncharacterized protein [Engystomops pustulosus]|uniref:uncharacterized protein isoform X12 n=1 Tax=Engystomops pustulosus TaxID=76066 RepID=UPI003AFA93AE